MSKWRARALDLLPDMRSEIQSAGSAGYFWIELISRFHGHYRPGSRVQLNESPRLIREICLYAIWCTRSESPNTQEAAWIEFYEGMPRFALQCTDLIYKQIIRDLVANIGIAEVEKMGVSLKPLDLKRFLVSGCPASGRGASATLTETMIV